ncbi:TIGR02996 domain-containing protein [Pyxidicoccus fallax]|uniref:TIGR02996 domain-containing protein n=1 Tax=Pyxidicoccus fallax TaxID=394095 RepID=A0A848LUL6_9BACT|nr:TIGR02996 domain-containing protein [Pyxidicoccus fallax]NMO21173.1 TIGR02996 domain-containing protein [Pyxidicoccus fallax]NPC82177.1 TIGR02996 domain-containing protein [Pyxidicoccus fallax]
MRDIVAWLLGLALEALERSEEEVALRRLLEAWDEGRAERIAVLAERLTKLANRPWPSHGRWFGLPRQLESIVDRSAQLSAEEMVREPCFLDILRADPRFTPSLLALAALPKAHDEVLFRQLCRLLILVKDPRSLEPLRALHASLPPDSGYAQQLGSAITLISQVEVPVLGAEASALCDALEKALTRREESEARSAPLREELFARIGANPDDDGARLVLADHLLEHEDPLGELIMLQCQPRPDEARVAQLLELHGAKWEAQLGPYVEPGKTRFERGLPVAAVAARMKWPSAKSPSPGPFWLTVREVDLDWHSSPALADWLPHPHLSRVTVLRQVSAAVATRLGRHPLPVRRLELRVDEAPFSEKDMFASLSSLPNLTSVTVRRATPFEVGVYANSVLGPRLERFEACGDGWSLVVTLSEEVPVEATLLHERSGASGELAQAIHYAKGFSIRGLRIRTQRRLAPAIVRGLEEATSGYMRVEWDLPPARDDDAAQAGREPLACHGTAGVDAGEAGGPMGQASQGFPPEHAARALVELGRSFLEKKQHTQAIAAFDDVLRQFDRAPWDMSLRQQVAEALVQRGVAFAQQGRPQQAFISFEELIRRFNAGYGLPDGWPPSSFRTGRNENRSSVPDLHLCLLVAEAFIQRAGILARQRQPLAAVASFDELVRYFGDAVEAPLREQLALTSTPVGMLFRRHGQSTKEVQDSRAPLRRPVSEALRKSGFCELTEAKRRIQQGEEGAASMLLSAKDRFEAAATLEPDRLTVLHHAGYAAFLRGSRDEARAIFSKVLGRGGEALPELAGMNAYPIPQDEEFRSLLRELSEGRAAD